MKTYLVFGTLSCVVLAGCSTANLWPQDTQPSAELAAQGRQWLDRAVEAQGGNGLLEAEHISITLRDHWAGWLMKNLAMPWAFSGQLHRMDIKPGTDDARLTFLEGDEKGSGWGIQRWVTYRFAADGVPEFDAPSSPDSTIKFWLPTGAYFPLLPWRIREASYVQYLGEEKIGGRTYQKVYASWGSNVPDALDQYVLYIDGKTHRLRWAQYTVRDFGRGIVGLMLYDDYRAVGDFTFAHSMKTVEDFDTDEVGLHAYAIESIDVQPELPADWTTPKPDLRATK